MNADWKDRLSEAGKKYDGHVTHGSLLRQTEVIDKMLQEFVDRLELIGDQCFNGGHKSRSRMFKALAKSFRVRYVEEKL